MTHKSINCPLLSLAIVIGFCGTSSTAETQQARAALESVLKRPLVLSTDADADYTRFQFECCAANKDDKGGLHTSKMLIENNRFGAAMLLFAGGNLPFCHVSGGCFTFVQKDRPGELEKLTDGTFTFVEDLKSERMGFRPENSPPRILMDFGGLIRRLTAEHNVLEFDAALRQIHLGMPDGARLIIRLNPVRNSSAFPIHSLHYSNGLGKSTSIKNIYVSPHAVVPLIVPRSICQPNELRCASRPGSPEAFDKLVTDFGRVDFGDERLQAAGELLLNSIPRDSGPSPAEVADFDRNLTLLAAGKSQFETSRPSDAIQKQITKYVMQPSSQVQLRFGLAPVMQDHERSAATFALLYGPRISRRLYEVNLEILAKPSLGIASSAALSQICSIGMPIESADWDELEATVRATEKPNLIRLLSAIKAHHGRATREDITRLRDRLKEETGLGVLYVLEALTEVGETNGLESLIRKHVDEAGPQFIWRMLRLTSAAATAAGRERLLALIEERAYPELLESFFAVLYPQFEPADPLWQKFLSVSEAVFLDEKLPMGVRHAGAMCALQDSRDRPFVREYVKITFAAQEPLLIAGLINMCGVDNDAYRWLAELEALLKSPSQPVRASAAMVVAVAGSPRPTVEERVSVCRIASTMLADEDDSVRDCGARVLVKISGAGIDIANALPALLSAAAVERRPEAFRDVVLLICVGSNRSLKNPFVETIDGKAIDQSDSTEWVRTHMEQVREGVAVWSKTQVGR